MHTPEHFSAFVLSEHPPGHAPGALAERGCVNRKHQIPAAAALPIKYPAASNGVFGLQRRKSAGYLVYASVSAKHVILPAQL